MTVSLRRKGAPKEDYNEYFRQYRAKNREKVRKIGRECMRRARANAKRV